MICIQHTLHANPGHAADVADASKHPLAKETWEFLHNEGHINQGVLQGEPAVKAACKPRSTCIMLLWSWTDLPTCFG